jgi:hypothetical protein
MRQGIRSVVCLEKFPQKGRGVQKILCGDGRGVWGLTKCVVQELVHIRVARWQYSVTILHCHLLSK